MGALGDLPPPEEYGGDGDLDVGVVAWGSTYGAALEAVGAARSGGVNAGILKVASLFPYHGERIRAFLKRCRHVLIPELNFEGQLATLLGHLNGRDVVRMNRVTGVPFSPEEIGERVKELAES
jgi:2-oxoglutarate ferredoxin oxidoreductase subunit alpha